MTSKITEPKIEISESPVFFNKKWGLKENITLSGKVIDDGGYSAILALHDTILSNYSAQTATLSIGAFSRTNVFLQKIDFGGSDYLTNTDYTVTFVSYPDAYFEESGILEPTDEWDFQESKNGTLTVRHTVSARGINTSNLDGTALANAKTFVQALVYPTSTVIPTTLTNFVDLPHSNFILTNRAENLNRITGEYSVEETYELDLFNSENAIIKYTVDISEPVNGFSTADISGTVEGGLNTTLADTRTAFNNLNLQTIIEGVSGLTLNPVPIVKTERQDEDANSISFNYSYDDNPTNTDSNNVVLSLSVSESKGEDNVKRYSLNGTVQGRLALEDKWGEIVSYYNESIDIYKQANVINLFSEYLDINDVNPNFESSNVLKNSYKGIIEFSITTNNKALPPEGLEEFEYVINIGLPTYKAKSYALVGRKHIEDYLTEEEVEEIPPEDEETPPEEEAAATEMNEYVLQKLGYFNRANLSISGFAIIKDEIDIAEGKEIIQKEVRSISSDFLEGNIILTEKNYNTNPFFGKRIEFVFAWDHDLPPVNQEDDLSVVLLL